MRTLATLETARQLFAEVNNRGAVDLSTLAIRSAVAYLDGYEPCRNVEPLHVVEYRHCAESGNDPSVWRYMIVGGASLPDRIGGFVISREDTDTMAPYFRSGGNERYSLASPMLSYATSGRHPLVWGAKVMAHLHVWTAVQPLSPVPEVPDAETLEAMRRLRYVLFATHLDTTGQECGYSNTLAGASYQTPTCPRCGEARTVAAVPPPGTRELVGIDAADRATDLLHTKGLLPY